MLASAAFGQPEEFDIIPKPASTEYGIGRFVIAKTTRIVANGKGEAEIAALLNDYLAKNYGFKLPVSKDQLTRDAVVLRLTPATSLPPESYNIQVDTNSIKISGAQRGLFYALQTFIQMLPPPSATPISLPFSAISDQPRFQYRGMHLDVARHFMPISFVKKYIDLMAQYKFNQFHWHLTEDQGWRIEIKKYPKLTEIGSKRPESHEGSYSNIFKGDGRPVEGFYTQEEIRDVVAYAKARYINVIPEIELPGHASAALAAYPEFGCKADYKYEVKKTWGIFKEVFARRMRRSSFLRTCSTRR